MTNGLGPSNTRARDAIKIALVAAGYACALILAGVLANG